MSELHHQSIQTGAEAGKKKLIAGRAQSDTHAPPEFAASNEHIILVIKHEINRDAKEGGKQRIAGPAQSGDREDRRVEV